MTEDNGQVITPFTREELIAFRAGLGEDDPTLTADDARRLVVTIDVVADAGQGMANEVLKIRSLLCALALGIGRGGAIEVPVQALTSLPKDTHLEITQMRFPPVVRIKARLPERGIIVPPGRA